MTASLEAQADEFMEGVQWNLTRMGCQTKLTADGARRLRSSYLRNLERDAARRLP